MGPARDADERRLDPATVAFGQRLDDAWQRAGYPTRAAFFRATGLPDLNAVHRYCRGELMPQIPALIAMARACRVSIDFLLLGADEPPASLLDWLETPTGQSVQRAEPEAIAFLRAMPVHGYRPRGTVFWDLAYQAWKHGLHDPDRVSRTARDTERHDD